MPPVLICVKNLYCKQLTRQYEKQYLTILAKFKKKAEIKVGEGEKIITNPHPYRVDGEIGRFDFTTHSILHESQSLYRVQFNNLGFGLITGILHKKSKCDIHNHLIL